MVALTKTLSDTVKSTFLDVRCRPTCAHNRSS